jgi:hypothetical protein
VVDAAVFGRIPTYLEILGALLAIVAIVIISVGPEIYARLTAKKEDP